MGAIFAVFRQLSEAFGVVPANVLLYQEYHWKTGECWFAPCICKMKVDTHKSVGVCFFMVR